MTLWPSRGRACPVCSGPLHRWPYGNARYCWPCYRAVRPLIVTAQRLVRKAVDSGALPPATRLYCVDCGGFAFGYEHRDYTAPLKVQPICRPCNHKRGQAYPLTPGAIEHIDLDALERAAA